MSINKQARKFYPTFEIFGKNTTLGKMGIGSFGIENLATGGIPLSGLTALGNLKEAVMPKMPEMPEVTTSAATTTAQDTAAAEAAAEAEAARLRRRRGRKATIVAGDLGSGDIDPAKLEKAAALG